MNMIFFAAGFACGVALLAYWPNLKSWFATEEQVVVSKAKDAVSKEAKKL